MIRNVESQQPVDFNSAMLEPESFVKPGRFPFMPQGVLFKGGGGGGDKPKTEEQRFRPGFGKSVLNVLAGEAVPLIPDADKIAEALDMGQPVVVNIKAVMEFFGRKQEEQKKD